MYRKGDTIFKCVHITNCEVVRAVVTLECKARTKIQYSQHLIVDDMK